MGDDYNICFNDRTKMKNSFTEDGKYRIATCPKCGRIVKIDIDDPQHIIEIMNKGNPMPNIKNNAQDFAEPIKVPSKGIGMAIAIGLIILLAINAVAIVPAGTRGVLLSWGASTGITYDEGLHFPIIPFQNSVVLMDTRVQVYTVNASSASKDLQDVGTQIALNYQLNPTEVSQTYDKYGVNYEATIIAPAVQEAVKASTANFTAEQLITQRAIVKNQIENQLDTVLAPYNIQVRSVAITQFEFSPQFTQAIESKVVAQQLLQRNLTILNTTRIIANQTVAIAQGNARARIINATANATAIELRANASAYAIDVITKQLENNPAYVKYLLASEWNGKTPQVVSSNGNSAIPLFQLNATNN